MGEGTGQLEYAVVMLSAAPSDSLYMFQIVTDGLHTKSSGSLNTIQTRSGNNLGGIRSLACSKLNIISKNSPLLGHWCQCTRFRSVY